LFYAILAVAVLVVMRIVSRSWTRTWIAPGGRAIGSTPIYHAVTTLQGDPVDGAAAEVTM
jgi:NNP family nitrate/nitrite transporter-like MFS transporter